MGNINEPFAVYSHFDRHARRAHYGGNPVCYIACLFNVPYKGSRLFYKPYNRDGKIQVNGRKEVLPSGKYLWFFG